MLGFGAFVAPERARSAPAPTELLIIRYDDYVPRNTSDINVPGIDLERRLFELFARYDATLIVGVIPDPAPGSAEGNEPYVGDPAWLTHPDDEWVKLLREYVQSGVVIPALHGHSHLRSTPPGHRPGEFIDRDYDWQLRMLQEGRAKLAAAVGQSIDIFVPPWNAWNQDTAKALQTAGFTWLSPDLHHADLPKGKLLVAPQTTADPKDLIGRTMLRDTYAVLVMHPFDFTGTGGEAYWRSLESVLAHRPEGQLVGKDALARLARDWSPRDVFAAAVSYDRFTACLRDMIGFSAIAPEPRPYVTSNINDDAQSARWILRLAAMATVAIGAFAAWIAGRVARRWPRVPFLIGVVCALGLLVLSIGALAILDAGYNIRGLRWQAQLLCVGGLVAASVVHYRHRRAIAAKQRSAPAGTVTATASPSKSDESERAATTESVGG